VNVVRMLRGCHANVARIPRRCHAYVVQQARITRVAPDVKSAIHSMGYFWSVYTEPSHNL
jgi:hypothetical protein